MKNIQWIKDGKKELLKKEDEVLIDLSFQPGGVSHFSINNKNFAVNRKGFWNPVYSVTENEKEVLLLSHNFWGSNGKLVFADGAVYACVYQNKGGLKMKFLKGDMEILSYGLEMKNHRPETTFHLGIALVDAEKLLLLAALGKVIFSTLFMEDSSGDDFLLSTLLLV